MGKIVLDSNILIYSSKGKFELESIPVQYSKFYISSISYMEVLGYNFLDSEKESLVKAFLNSFEIIETSPEIRHIVIEYRRKKKIKLPDAIILATAKFLNSDLLTNNPADFQNIDDEIQIISPGL